MRARFLGALALTWGLGACAGIQVNTDYNPETDFNRYRTFAWMEGSGGGADLRVYGGVGATQTTAREYTVGTLVIDVYNARVRELVWRGAGEGKVKQARNPEESQERINQAVTRILRDSPVA